VRSSEIRKSLNIEPLLLRIERSQLRWFGHVSRMPREKTCWTTTNTLAKLHWGYWMESPGALPKRNVGGGGGPWCVAAQSWAAAPATFTDMSGFWKMKKNNNTLVNFHYNAEALTNFAETFRE